MNLHSLLLLNWKLNPFFVFKLESFQAHLISPEAINSHKLYILYIYFIAIFYIEQLLFLILLFIVSI